MTALLDDHLLRDWMARRDDALESAVADEIVATTNLWYARLCKTAARARGGAVLRGWADQERRHLIEGLVALPDDIEIVPLQDLAWDMGDLLAEHSGLSTLGAEAAASARYLGARVLVSDRDDGPGLRRWCSALGIRYISLPR